MPLPASGSTIVQVAGKDAIAFGDFVSKFIVAHPKLSAVLALVVGLVVGHFGPH